MRSSFEQYVAARAPGLTRLAFVLCGDHHLAQDLVQEALAKVYRRWHRIESDDPDAYVRKAIVRSYLSWRRRRSSTETVTASLPEHQQDTDFSASFANRAELWALLATLSKTQRTVLVLRYLQDLPDAQIAEVLGCAEATVRVHARRGLAKLRDQLPAPTTSLPAPATGANR